MPDLSKVTLTRGSEMTELHHHHRNRHLTDDSSLGSCKYEVNILFILLHIIGGLVTVWNLNWL